MGVETNNAMYDERNRLNDDWTNNSMMLTIDNDKQV